MNKTKNEKGSVVIEASLILPVLLVFLMMFVYLINMFIVQTMVQYALNQTVNELGNYTYILNEVGFVDWLNNEKDKDNEKTNELKNNASQLIDTYDKVMDLCDDTKETGSDVENTVNNISEGNVDIEQIKSTINGLSSYKEELSGTASSAKRSWGIIKTYAKNPSKLLEQLVSQGKLELINAGGGLLGAFLGKIMMYNYADEDFLANSGVVSTDYNGTKKVGEYNTGVDGMDFSASMLLGDSVTSNKEKNKNNIASGLEPNKNKSDSRVIDIIVYYRIKFPFNITKLFPVDESSSLYDNSFLVVQRATGYGWINGDGSGKDEYNE